jgi:hypothetical protein
MLILQYRVIHEGKLTDSFEVTSGVRQGCILSMILLLLVLDNVMNKVIKGRKRGVQWRMMGSLEDLDFADEICLLVPRWSDI